MAVVNDLIDDFIDHDEVLANALFVDEAAVVTDNLEHAVDDVEHAGGRCVMLCCCHEEDPKLLREEVIHSINRLNFLVSLIKLTKVGGGSPGQNLIVRKKTSHVYFPNSCLTTYTYIHSLYTCE